MSDVYENCPAFENDKFLLRFSQLDDAEDLVSVYSDKNALPFFNSDNCHGDNFYYPNEDRMRQTEIISLYDLSVTFTYSTDFVTVVTLPSASVSSTSFVPLLVV